MYFPFSDTTPTLSPSPSKAIPQSACTSNTFFFRSLRFSSTAGSGIWLGKFPSEVSYSGIYSIFLFDMNISFAIILVVPLPQSYTTFILFIFS